MPMTKQEYAKTHKTLAQRVRENKLQEKKEESERRKMEQEERKQKHLEKLNKQDKLNNPIVLWLKEFLKDKEEITKYNTIDLYHDYLKNNEEITCLQFGVRLSRLKIKGVYTLENKYRSRLLIKSEILKEEEEENDYFGCCHCGGTKMVKGEDCWGCVKKHIPY